VRSAECEVRSGKCSVLGACVLAGLVLACSGPSVERIRPRAVAPEQERMAGLLRQNEARPSDPDLADAYAVVNAQYFGNRLPPVRIRWEPGLDQIGPMIASDFRLEGMTDGTIVLIHPALQQDSRQLRAVICHEMVHVALRDAPHDHGSQFQALLRSLAERGAFEGVVATDAERDTLAASLEQSTRRLASELSDLQALQKRIEGEAPSLTRDALHDRVWDFNRRVRQHNEDVDGFNRDVERYNLMITYPDGLDRERLRTRGTVAPAG